MQLKNKIPYMAFVFCGVLLLTGLYIKYYKRANGITVLESYVSSDNTIFPSENKWNSFYHLKEAFDLFESLIFFLLEKYLFNLFLLRVSNNIFLSLFFVVVMSQVGLLAIKLICYYAYEKKRSKNTKTFKVLVKEYSITAIKAIVFKLVISFCTTLYFLHLSKYVISCGFLYMTLHVIYVNLSRKLTIYFIKPSPFENTELSSKIKDLAESAGYKIDSISTYGESTSNKKPHVYITGNGKTKKILLSNKILENYTDEEILVVITHKLGQIHNNQLLKKDLFFSFFVYLLFFEVSILLFGNTFVNLSKALSIVIILLLQIPANTILQYITKAHIKAADKFTVDHGYGAELIAYIRTGKDGECLQSTNVVYECLYYPNAAALTRINEIKKTIGNLDEVVLD